MQQVIQKGDYYLLANQIVGNGSFGNVFKCYKKNNQDELFCMKILTKPSNSLNSNIKNTIQTELTMFKELKNSQSENLVKLIDYIETDDELCLVMELCDCDLYQLFQKYQTENQWFSRQEQFQMIRQILKGAQFLKENKIVHRDIKPQNILVKVLNHDLKDQKKIYKIADFGFSKTLVDIYRQQDMTLVGTQTYLAPEIYYKQQFSGKCDIFSYGILFHQIVFRKFPANYNSKEQIQQFYEQIKQNPYKCQILEDRDGKLLAELIEKMILFDQNKRLSFEDLLQYNIMLLKDPLFQPISQKNQYQNDNENNLQIFLRIYTILDNLYRKSILCKTIAEKLKKFNFQNNINLLKMQYFIEQIGFYEIKIGFAMIHLIISDFQEKILELCDVPHFINLLKLYLKENNLIQQKLHQKIKSEFYIQQKALTQEISDVKFKIYHLKQQQLIKQQTDDHLFSIESLSEKQQIKVLCNSLKNLIDVQGTCELISNYDIDLLKKINEIPAIESRFDFFEYKLYKSDQIIKL